MAQERTAAHNRVPNGKTVKKPTTPLPTLAACLLLALPVGAQEFVSFFSDDAGAASSRAPSNGGISGLSGRDLSLMEDVEGKVSGCFAYQPDPAGAAARATRPASASPASGDGASRAASDSPSLSGEPELDTERASLASLPNDGAAVSEAKGAPDALDGSAAGSAAGAFLNSTGGGKAQPSGAANASASVNAHAAPLPQRGPSRGVAGRLDPDAANGSFTNLRRGVERANQAIGNALGGLQTQPRTPAGQ